MSEPLLSPSEKKGLGRLLRHLGADTATLTQVAPAKAGEPQMLDMAKEGAAPRRIAAALVVRAAALGLAELKGGRLSARPEARAFLRRALVKTVGEESGEGFLDQHRQTVSAAVSIDDVSRTVRLNLAESPLGPIARLKDKAGAAFLPPEAVDAGERLLADFTRGQLQPRVTASWEPRLSSRGGGRAGGIADLTDSAVAARARVGRAVDAMGPELSGVALDVCCFMKGLEVVERERQWPARSAKLMLRAALLALSRHYRPPGPARRQRLEHWGTADFRPDL